jgi:hypothetical protein
LGYFPNQGEVEMKKTLALVFASAGLQFLVCTGSKETAAAKPAASDFHVGVVTGTVSSSEDDLRVQKADRGVWFGFYGGIIRMSPILKLHGRS